MYDKHFEKRITHNSHNNITQNHPTSQHRITQKIHLFAPSSVAPFANWTSGTFFFGASVTSPTGMYNLESRDIGEREIYEIYKIYKIYMQRRKLIHIFRAWHGRSKKRIKINKRYVERKHFSIANTWPHR